MDPNILLIIGIIVLLIFLLLFIIGHILFKVTFDRKYTNNKENDGAIEEEDNYLMLPTGKKLEKFNNSKKEAFNKLPFETLTIQSYDGLKLYGNYLKGEDSNITVILVHGYRSSPIGDFVAIIEMYLKRKYNILLVENRAHGRSEGKYIGFGELDRYDIAKWVEKIKTMNPNTNIFLHGCSMGAATVTHTCHMGLDIKGIIADCGFTSILDITKYLIHDLYKLPYFPFGEMARLNAWIFAKTPFNKTNSKEVVKDSKVPIAFISGKEDNFVPCQMTIDAYNACKSKKYLLLVENTGHVASYMEAKDEYENIVDKLINDALSF